MKKIILGNFNTNNLKSGGYYSFSWGCNNLETIIIKHNEFVPLKSYTIFMDSGNHSPIKNKTGHVYVNDDLVEQYRADAQWSHYSIKPMSELPAEEAV